MTSHRFNIVATDNATPNTSTPRSRGKELQAYFERQWLLDPNQFNPNRNCKERERIERSWHLLCENIDLNNTKAADIGCGAGLFSRRLRDAGADVDAVDIAENALKQLEKKDTSHIRPICDAMPHTSLLDNTYDLVVCTELIAELPNNDHRLFFSELNRIIKADGWVLCSTGIDIDSEGVLQQLYDMASSEFEIHKDVYSYHSLHIRLNHILEAPSKIVEASRDAKYRQDLLREHKGLPRLWFRLNSLRPLAWLWQPIWWVTKPLLGLLKQNRMLLLFLEKISRFCGPENPSHVIFLARRRPLPSFDATVVPEERPGKKQIWE